MAGEPRPQDRSNPRAFIACEPMHPGELLVIGMAIGAFVLRHVADRFGRCATILTCLAIMASGMGLAALSGSVVSLSLVRLYTGLGIGGMLAATNAIVAECANARRRSLSVAIMAGGYSTDAIAGGIIASAHLASTSR